MALFNPIDIQNKQRPLIELLQRANPKATLFNTLGQLPQAIQQNQLAKMQIQQLRQINPLELALKNAQVQETTSKAAQEQAKANALTGQGGPNPAIDTMADSIYTGKLAPSQLPGFGTNSLKAKVLSRVADKYPGFDFGQAELNYQAGKTYTNYINSGSFQGTIKYLKSVRPNLDTLVNQADTIANDTGLKTLNKATLQAQIELGNKDAANYLATITETSDQIAKILQGGGTGNATSDAKLNQALSLLDKGYTPSQIKAVAGGLSNLLKSRENALLAPTIQTIPGQKSANKQLNQTNNSGIGPKIRIQDSSGQLHDIPASNVGKAKQMDPGLKVLGGP